MKYDFRHLPSGWLVYRLSEMSRFQPTGRYYPVRLAPVICQFDDLKTAADVCRDLNRSVK